MTDRFILKRIDDFEIFCHYYGEDIAIGTAVSSPFREDHKPSFSLFVPTDPDEDFFEKGYSLLFKDFAYNVCGDVFVFVALLKGITRTEAIDYVGSELLDGVVPIRSNISNVQHIRKKLHSSKTISIIKKEWTDSAIDYWGQYGISVDMLTKHNVSQVSMYYIDGKQFYARKLCFAYEVCGKYQIYSPLNDKFRFVNNLSPEMFFGYINLPEKGDVLIIDKSKKDVIFCYEVLNIPAVSPKGEGILLHETAMVELSNRFKTIYLMLDNDKAGHKCTAKWLQKYNYLKPIFLPNHKDKTDAAKDMGVAKAKIHILKIINESSTLNSFTINTI